MSPDFLLFTAQFLAAIVLSLVLELGFKRRYEPNYTWVVVTWGVAQVGLLVAARLALAPVPELLGAEAAWWTWWLIFWSFVAASLPVITWQVVIQVRRWKTVQATWERWVS